MTTVVDAFIMKNILEINRCHFKMLVKHALRLFEFLEPTAIGHRESLYLARVNTKQNSAGTLVDR